MGIDNILQSTTNPLRYAIFITFGNYQHDTRVLTTYLSLQHYFSFLQCKVGKQQTIQTGSRRQPIKSANLCIYYLWQTKIDKAIKYSRKKALYGIS